MDNYNLATYQELQRRLKERQEQISTGQSLIDGKLVCKELGIKYISCEFSKNEMALVDAMYRQEKCKICNKHGIDCKNCFYVKVDEQAGKYFISYSNCERWKNYKQQEKINRLMEQSNVGKLFEGKTFNNFKILPATENAYNDCLDFCTNYIPKSRGLRLHGRYGCGKTHLAAAILNNLLKQNIPSMMIVTANLFDCIKQGFNDKEKALIATELVNKAKQVDVLILDDFGAEKDRDSNGNLKMVGSWERENLFLLINTRYENNLTTIITTNYNMQELFELFGERIMSRIAEMTKPVGMKGAENYRIRLAQAV